MLRMCMWCVCGGGVSQDTFQSHLSSLLSGGLHGGVPVVCQLPRTALHGGAGVAVLDYQAQRGVCPGVSAAVQVVRMQSTVSLRVPEGARRSSIFF